jgi:hypothetical protein
MSIVPKSNVPGLLENLMMGILCGWCYYPDLLPSSTATEIFRIFAEDVLRYWAFTENQPNANVGAPVQNGDIGKLVAYRSFSLMGNQMIGINGYWNPSEVMHKGKRMFCHWLRWVKLQTI